MFQNDSAFAQEERLRQSAAQLKWSQKIDETLEVLRVTHPDANLSKVRHTLEEMTECDTKDTARLSSLIERARDELG